MVNGKVSSIFVQISSYHDFELPRTIIDCLKKSSGKNQINFGVHLVYYEKDEISIPNISNITFEKHKAPTNIGVGIGRFNANEMYSDEDYYLQIDSHMRFNQGWDISLISTYLKYVGYGLNPVISSYPSSYDYEGYVVKIHNEDAEVCYTEFNKKDSFSGNSYIPHQEAIQNKRHNIFTKSISGASIFSDGSISKIKPNKKMFFWGEEIVQAIRFYTHGYDLVLPEKQNFHHLYNNGHNAVSNLRRNAQGDFPEQSEILNKISYSELARIVTEKPIGLQELGSIRTLEQYEEYAGVDFANKKLKEKPYCLA